MNKSLAITAFLPLVLAFGGCAGLAPVNPADLTFSEIIEVPGMNQNEIYDGARVWIAENFRSAKSVLEHEDKNAGTIIGNGRMRYPCDGIDCLTKSSWSVSYTMRVDSKNERVRITFLNLSLSWPAERYSSAFDGPVSQQSDLEKIKPHLISLAKKMALEIQTPAVNKNW